MSYNMRKDAYSCDYCGFEIKWDDSDDVHGEMWGCEECGATFCSKCFIDDISVLFGRINSKSFYNFREDT